MYNPQIPGLLGHLLRCSQSFLDMDIVEQNLARAVGLTYLNTLADVENGHHTSDYYGTTPIGEYTQSYIGVEANRVQTKRHHAGPGPV